METEKKSLSKLDRSIESGVDFIFSNKELKWLTLIFIIGVVLRFFLARNISALGDEMVHGPHIIGFLHSGLISTIAHSPLWFYLGDIFVRILGISMFSLRFLSFFYGSLTILLVYLISSKIFNKKIALLSSFLLSVSFFTIRYTLMEMDLSATFFLIFAVYFFINSLEGNKFPILAAVCIGVASLIKTLSLFFIPAFLFGFFLFSKDKTVGSAKIKKIVIFVVIILFFFLPILAHNYFWFKDKGKVDIYFAQYFFPSLRADYASQLGYDSGFLLDKFVSGFFDMTKIIFLNDPILLLLGLLGIALSFKLVEKKKPILFLLVFEISGFVFLLLSNHLPTHYTTLIPVLAIFGGFAIDELSKSISRKNKTLGYRKILTALIIVILLFQVYLLLPHLTSKSALSQTREYITKNIDKEAIVVADSRIYRGRIVFLLHEYHYLESSYMGNLLQINEQLPGQDIPTKIYFLECARDDCGWGTVQAGQLNDSSENLVNLFSAQGNLDKVILGGGGYDEITGNPYFKIYSSVIPLKPQIISEIDSTHEWFYYPVNYRPKEKVFDNYDVYGPIDNLLYQIMWIILVISILLALILPVVVFIEISKKERNS